MLKLKKRIHLPTISSPTVRPLALSPVVDEEDELIVDSQRQAEVEDSAWTLDAVPDTEKLQRDWEAISEDIRHDPEWITFSDDED